MIQRIIKSSRRIGPQFVRTFCSVHEEEDPEVDELLDETFDALLPSSLRPAIQTGLNLLIVQPKIKWGPEKTKLLSRTTPDLQIQENIALVESLDDWTVEDTLLLSTKSLLRKHIFGSGQLESIKELTVKNNRITGVLMGIDLLPGYKQSDIQEMFHLPVFDRYSIVLQIFRQRARTKEAKLQVSLAELSYIKSRFRQSVDYSLESVAGVPLNIGHGDQPFHVRKEILKDRETRLKKAIEKLRTKRQFLRSHRIKQKIPSVAIVGYTNSGKSSLIKALTRNPSIQAKDVLFHTLDIRVFEGRLDNIHQVLFIDTIGFIADIPTALIEAFKATLEEVTLADLVIHVSDVSHPDVKNQRTTVLETLKDIDIGRKLSTTMIEVGNKIDKMVTEGGKDLGPRVDLLVSATEGINLNVLRKEIEDRLFMSLGCFFKTFKVSNGGLEYQWLIRNAFVSSVEVDPEEDNNLIIKTRMTEAAAGKFRKQFPTFYTASNEINI